MGLRDDLQCIPRAPWSTRRLWQSPKGVRTDVSCFLLIFLILLVLVITCNQ